MKILSYGSLNIDKVYTMEHFVQPGETKSSLKYETFCGGKGLNQSIAIALAGVKEVYHAGKIGSDGLMLMDRLKEVWVDTKYVLTSTNTPTGHAIIQVEVTGQNSIILFGGANKEITTTDVDNTLEFFCKGDIILLQNEISSLAYILQKAKEKGMIVILNPSPIDENLCNIDLSSVDYFILNEIEGKTLTSEENPQDICKALCKKYKKSKVVLTLGSKGAVYFDGVQSIRQLACNVEVVDTTAAGDTFTGYFIAGLTKGTQIEKILQDACKAAAISVSRNGASDSIPTREEVDASIIQ
jgi:Sugar kinases, ribokinase family